MPCGNGCSPKNKPTTGGAVPSTLEAIYALLEGGTDWLAPDESKTSIVWGGQEMKNNPEEPFWD